MSTIETRRCSRCGITETEAEGVDCSITFECSVCGIVLCCQCVLDIELTLGLCIVCDYQYPNTPSVSSDT